MLPTNFAGRSKMVVNIIKLFLTEKVVRVNVFGMKGVGKTTLCRAVAWWLSDRGFVERVLVFSEIALQYLRVTGRNVASLLLLARNLFDLPYSTTTPLEEQRNILYQFLQERPSLVMIDDWDSIEVADKTVMYSFILALPQSTIVMVNGTDTLPVAQFSNYELDGIDPESRLPMMIECLRANKFFENRSKLTQEEQVILKHFADSVDGHPLAIKICAEMAQTVPLAEIEQKFFADCMNLTQEPPTEIQELFRNLEKNYRALPPIVQKVFRLMGLTSYASAVDLEGADLVNGVRDALDMLLSKSLIVHRQV